MDLRRFFPHMGAAEPPTLPAAPAPSSSSAAAAAAPETAPAATSAPTSMNALRFAPTASKVQFRLASSQYQEDQVREGIDVTPITMYKSEKMPRFAGSRIGESRDFIAYCTRKPVVRILHRATFKNMLLQGHKLPVSDIHFSPLLPSMLSSVSSDGTCIVWELKLDESCGEIIYRTTVVLNAPQLSDPAAQGDAAPAFHRVRWSHANQRMFAVARGGTVAVLELSESLWNLQMAAGDNGVPLGSTNAQLLQAQTGAINDLVFSHDGQKLITCGQDGSVKTWALGAVSGSPPLATFSPYEGRPVQALAVLGSAGLVTSVGGNTELSMWTSSSGSWSSGQTLSLTPPGVLASVPFRWSVSPSGSCLVIAPEDQPSLVLVSLRTGTPSPRMDAAVQVDLALPVLSLHCSALVDGKDPTAMNDGQLDVFCVQTRAIQQYRIDFGKLLADVPQQNNPVVVDVTGSNASSVNGDAPVTRSGMTSLGSTSQLLSPMELLGVSAKPTPSVAESAPAPMAMPMPAVPMPKSSKAPKQSEGASSSSSHVPDAQTATLVREAMESQMTDLRAFLKQQSLERAQEERERQKLLLQALAKTVQTIPQTVQVLLQEELNSAEFIDRVADAVVAKTSRMDGSGPNAQLVHSVQTGVQQAIASSMGDQRSGLVRSLADATQREMSAAFRSAFSESLVPAFQAGCQEMVQQWRGAAASVNAGGLGDRAATAAAAARASAPPSRPSQGGFGDASWAPSTTAGAGAGGAATSTANGNGGSTDDSAVVAEKLAQIDSQLARGHFEGAFYEALLSCNLQVVVATCRRVDRDQLFAKSPAVMSQGILLTLLQQLSVDLTTDTDLKVLWITSVFFQLDLNDATISEHAPKYLAELKAGLEKMEAEYTVAGKYPASAVAYKELRKALQSL